MDPPSARELGFAVVGALVASTTCIGIHNGVSACSGANSTTALATVASHATTAESSVDGSICSAAASRKRKGSGPSKATRKWHRKHCRLPLGEPIHSNIWLDQPLSSESNSDQPSEMCAPAMPQDESTVAAATFERVEVRDCKKCTAPTVRRVVICQEALAWLKETLSTRSSHGQGDGSAAVDEALVLLDALQSAAPVAAPP